MSLKKGFNVKVNVSLFSDQSFHYLTSGPKFYFIFNTQEMFLFCKRF